MSWALSLGSAIPLPVLTRNRTLSWSLPGWVQVSLSSRMQNQQVLRKIWMRAPQKHDELRALRGILMSVALGLVFWLVIILCVVLLIRHFA